MAQYYYSSPEEAQAATAPRQPQQNAGQQYLRQLYLMAKSNPNDYYSRNAYMGALRDYYNPENEGGLAQQQLALQQQQLDMEVANALMGAADPNQQQVGQSIIEKYYSGLNSSAGGDAGGINAIPTEADLFKQQQQKVLQSMLAPAEGEENPSIDALRRQYAITGLSPEQTAQYLPEPTLSERYRYATTPLQSEIEQNPLMMGVTPISLRKLLMSGDRIRMNRLGIE